ncbi:MAG: DNA methyltransferase [Thermoplasmata archaeon]
MVKGGGYYYDRESGREAQTSGAQSRGAGTTRKPPAPAGSGIGNNESYRAAMIEQPPSEAGRNMLSVWRIPTHAFPGKHYATFSEEIPRRCIAVGTSERGCCPECGAPFVRVTGMGEPDREWQRSAGGDADGEYSGESAKFSDGTGAQDPSEVKRRVLAGMIPNVTVGWAPTCGHYPDPCDRCGVGWTHRTVRKKASTFNVRVRDAKSGSLAFKSGMGGEAADATDQEIEEYGGADNDGAVKVVEVGVSWPGCKCRPVLPAIILDIFAGSGTTLVAARKLGRRSIGIELSPAYAQMARERIAEETAALAPKAAPQMRLTEFAEAA